MKTNLFARARESGHPAFLGLMVVSLGSRLRGNERAGWPLLSRRGKEVS